MRNLKLDIAFWDYDRTRALTDGTVKIKGVEPTFHGARIVTEIFEAMIRQRKYDVSELGMTYYLRTLDAEDPPFIALPIFPNRAFRHSAIYIHKASGIQSPEDLAGKTIGELAVYGHDAGVMPKGTLSDEYGFKPETCRWIIGGLDWPMPPIDFIPRNHPPNIEVTDIPKGKELGSMLEAGEIDALISADVPKCILQNSPKVTRLFPDYRAVERDYYQRTGVFPIMHTVVIRRDLLARHPEVARSVYEAFCEAKKVAVEQYRHGLIFNSMGTMIPWFNGLINEDRDLLGEDWWPYAVDANRKALNAYLRYHFEQGLAKRAYTCEDIFVPDLLTT
jgi:hypothetical protein